MAKKPSLLLPCYHVGNEKGDIVILIVQAQLGSTIPTMYSKPEPFLRVVPIVVSYGSSRLDWVFCTRRRRQLKFPSGDEYVGQFRLGKANGTGRYIDLTGEIYEGPFSNGHRHGNTPRTAGAVPFRSPPASLRTDNLPCATSTKYACKTLIRK
jgi:hypothetical protein